MPAETFFPDAERIIAKARDDGETPESFTLTSALYQHAYPGREWRTHAERAQYGYEPARELLRLSVTVELGAHHAWKLHCASGAVYDAGGKQVYR